MHPLRRAATVVLLTSAWLLGSAVPVLGAEPPPDVLLDGTVTVRFVVDGTPIGDAATTLTATRPGVADPLQSLTGVTDADGVVVFSGVARPDAGAPPVLLDIAAQRSAPNDCGGQVTQEGWAQVEAAAVVEVDLVGSGTSSCETFEIEGLISYRRQPVLLASGEATVTYPGEPAEALPVVLEADPGEFTILFRGWAGPEPAVMTFDFRGEERRTDDPDSACELRVVDVATATIDVEVPTDVGLEIVATPTVVGKVCGTQGTPGPDGPARTLPPTDGGSSPASGIPSAPGAATILVGLALALTAVLTVRGVSRGGS